jgi:hypothetical protein
MLLSLGYYSKKLIEYSVNLCIQELKIIILYPVILLSKINEK